MAVNETEQRGRRKRIEDDGGKRLYDWGESKGLRIKNKKYLYIPIRFVKK